MIEFQDRGKLINGSITLWYRWAVADEQALRALRAPAGTLEIARSWQAPAVAKNCKACHALGITTRRAGARNLALKNAIKRTVYFRQRPETDQATVRRFEQDLLEMPMQIPVVLAGEPDDIANAVRYLASRRK